MLVQAIVAVGLCLAMAACGTGDGLAQRAADDLLSGDPSDDGLLFVASGDGLRAIRAGSGSVARTIPEGLAAPRLASLVSTTFEGSDTTVTRTTPAGATLAQASVPGDVVVRVVTDELVALADRAGAGATPYLPAPKERTRIVILDDEGTQREYRLEGNFEPEAFKVDGSELFMIEYIPAMAPERYRVRRLRLGSGRVLPIGRLKLRAPGQMQGTGRTQVMSPYGDELYTLYTQQAELGHPSEAGAHAGSAHGEREAGGHAFVHLLNLQDSWAHCIDLPPAFGSASATGSAIAVNPSGKRVFVADWTRGVIAALNPRRVSVVARAALHLGHAETRTSAAATNEAVFVGGEETIVVIDPATLAVVDRWTVDGEVRDLEVVEDLMYVTTPSSILVLDAGDGHELRRIAVEDATAIEGIVPASR